jgi:hypothetical protein
MGICHASMPSEVRLGFGHAIMLIICFNAELLGGPGALWQTRRQSAMRRNVAASPAPKQMAAAAAQGAQHLRWRVGKPRRGMESTLQQQRPASEIFMVAMWQSRLLWLRGSVGWDDGRRLWLRRRLLPRNVGQQHCRK